MARLRHRLLYVVATLLLVAPLVGTAEFSATSAQRNDSAPLSEAMPAGTPLYVATELDLSNPQYLQLSGLLAETLVPRAGDTIAAIVETLTKYLAQLPSDLVTVLQGEIGVGITNLGALDSGETSTSGVLNAAQLDPPGYAVVLHPAEAGSARQVVQNWFTDKLEESGFEPETTQDGAVLILSNPDPSSSYIPAVPSVIVFSGDYILIGASLKELQPFIAATRGNVPTLADSEDLRELNDALPSERLLFGYVNGEQLFGSVTKVFGSSSLAESISDPIGQTAFTLAANDPGMRFESVSKPVDSGGQDRERTAGENPTFATLVPDSTLAMVAGQDLGQSWAIQQTQKVLLSVLTGSLGAGDIDLTGVDVDAQFGVMAMLTGINFKTDMLDRLAGDYGAALFSLDADNPLASSAVIASELDSPDRVSVSVTSLGPLIQSAGAGRASVTTASVNGQTVNNVTLVDPVATTIQYGVVNDMLMVGLGDGIATLANTPDASLADSSSYQAALGELPKDYDGVVYIDVRQVARALAPLVFQAIADSTNSGLADCVAENASGDSVGFGRSVDGSALGTICSVLGGLLGPDALQDFIASRLPGPLAAVTYEDGGLQHVSGILNFGSNE